MSLQGKKRLGKKDRKGWHYDEILVHLKEFGPKMPLLDFHFLKKNCLLLALKIGVVFQIIV